MADANCLECGAALVGLEREWCARCRLEDYFETEATAPRDSRMEDDDEAIEK